MADCIESAASKAARNEALGAAYHLDPARDIAGPLGQPAANYWGQVIDFENMLQSQEFRIEAGSIRKPNRERDKENANAAVQVWGPLLQGVATNMGDVNPINELITQWGKANDADVSRMKLQPPQPQQGPTPEEQKLQLEQQKMQMQAQMDQARMQMEQVQQQQEMQIRQQEAEMDMAAQQTQLQVDAVRGQQELVQDDRAFEQEMRQLQQKHAVEMKMLQDKQVMAKKQAEQKATQQRRQQAKKKATV
jgi:hypothetical protein